MTIYHVQAAEIWYQWYEVEADSSAQAANMVSDGLGQPMIGALSYNDTLDNTKDEWLVLESDLSGITTDDSGQQVRDILTSDDGEEHDG